MFKPKVIGILFVAVIAATWVHAQQDSLPEKYNKKVLLEAKWGDGPGEFKLEIGEYPYGPGAFVIDDQGNIYMANIDRIHKFGKEGRFIKTIPVAVFGAEGTFGVDNDGNIYIAEVMQTAKTQDSLGMRLIKQYDATGKLLRVHHIMVDMTSLGAKYGYMAANIGQFPEVKNGEILIPNGKKEYVIGRVDKAYSKSEQKIREKELKFRYEVSRKREKYYLEIETKDKSPSKQLLTPIINKIGKKVYLGNCIGIDRYGNGFIFATIGKVGERKAFETWKFNADGKLLSRIPLGHRGEDYIGSSGHRREVIDEEGNIYYLLASKDLVSLYKYEKENIGGK